MTSTEPPTPEDQPVVPLGWEREAAIEVLQGEGAVLCGIVNAAQAALTDLVGDALDRELWGQGGVMSPEHWVAWQFGLSPTRARQVTAAARRRRELPECMGRFRTGALSADQFAAVVAHVPGVKDTEVAEFAVQATVSQLRRAVAKYNWGPDKPPKERVTQRKCSFGGTGDGSWRLSAEAPPEEGAKIEAGLAAMRKQMLADAPDDETRAAINALDVLLGVFDKAADNDDAERLGRHKRHMIHLHLEIGLDGDWVGRIHMGGLLHRSIVYYQACDATIQPIMHQLGLPVSVGRAARTVPTRTRVVVEHRDCGCRVPGCKATRVEIHHIVHWLDGGTTDTFNLVALCSRHHHLHHQGVLGIVGNADEPGGLAFTDRHGQPIAGSGRAHPPNAPPGQAATQAGLPWQPYAHGSGERFDLRNTWFGPPTAA